MAGSQDVWAGGDAYEAYVGRWSRAAAAEFLAWLDLPPRLGWLDVGCGTGALSATILAGADPAEVRGIDPSQAFIAVARGRLTDPRARFETGDARDLPVADATFDAVVSGLVLNFVTEPDRAMAEMRRAVRPGGRVAAYVWDYAGGMQQIRHFWDAAIALRPEDREKDEAVRFPMCRPDALADLFARAGLTGVETRALDVPARFADFDEYWTPFLGGNFPAPAYALALSEDDRGALRERLRATLPTSADGSIDLIARAWAVQGVA